MVLRDLQGLGSAGLAGSKWGRSGKHEATHPKPKP